jgi:hypothetical protein
MLGLDAASVTYYNQGRLRNSFSRSSHGAGWSLSAGPYLEGRPQQLIDRTSAGHGNPDYVSDRKSHKTLDLGETLVDMATLKNKTDVTKELDPEIEDAKSSEKATKKPGSKEKGKKRTKSGCLSTLAL